MVCIHVTCKPKQNSKAAHCILRHSPKRMDWYKSFDISNLCIQLFKPKNHTKRSVVCPSENRGASMMVMSGLSQGLLANSVAYNRKHTSRPETYSLRYFVWLLASVKDLASRSCASWASLFGSLRAVLCGRGQEWSNKVPTTAKERLQFCSVVLKVGNVGICRWQNTFWSYLKGIGDPEGLFSTFLWRRKTFVVQLKAEISFLQSHQHKHYT